MFVFLTTSDIESEEKVAREPLRRTRTRSLGLEVYLHII